MARQLSAMPDERYLNLGSGPRGLDDPHWLNIDGFPDRNVHHLVDFRRPLPFADDSFDGVFCEHVLEHFTLEDGEAISREVCRMLKPNGRFRVIVPDAERVMRCYFEDGLKDHRDGETPMEAVNSYFRQRYEHQFMYDGETMVAMLKRAGFGSADVAGFRSGGGMSSLDDECYAAESLYVEARK